MFRHPSRALLTALLLVPCSGSAAFASLDGVSAFALPVTDPLAPTCDALGGTPEAIAAGDPAARHETIASEFVVVRAGERSTSSVAPGSSPASCAERAQSRRRDSAAGREGRGVSSAVGSAAMSRPMQDVLSLEPSELERFLERRRASPPQFPLEMDLAENLVEVLRKANEFVPSQAGSILLDDPLTKNSDDRLENELNRKVCSGELTIAEAQRRESQLKHTAG